jgi:5-methylcytosine-specific restriction endonuclease McrA
MADRRLFVDLGHASVLAYAEATLDMTRRQAAHFVRIGRALPELPAVDAAFARGDVGWTKVRELVGVATSATESAWLERALALTSRDLERHVRSARGGLPPSEEEVEKGPARVRLVIEMDAADAEVLRDAMALLRGLTGDGADAVDDGSLLAEMARRVVHDAEPGESPTGERYVTVLEHCPRCRHTAGVDSEVTDTHVGLAGCDGEVVEMRPGPERGHASKTIPPAVRRAVLLRDRHRCAVPGCRNRIWVNLHHVVERHRGGGHSEGNLVTLCTTHHTIVHDGHMAVRAVPGGFEFEFANGAVTRTPPLRAPRAR